MTDTDTIEATSPETTSERLSRRIDQARDRAAERARHAADATGGAASEAVRLVRKHPVVAIGGAVLIGAAVAQVLPKKMKKKAAKNSRRAIGLAATAAELALAYGRKAGESTAEGARDGAGWVGHAVTGLADALGERLSDGSQSARKGWFELAGMSSEKARDAGNLAAQQLRKFAKRLES